MAKKIAITGTSRCSSPPPFIAAYRQAADRLRSPLHFRMTDGELRLRPLLLAPHSRGGSGRVGVAD
jgi:hypothetical protein